MLEVVVGYEDVGDESFAKYFLHSKDSCQFSLGAMPKTQNIAPPNLKRNHWETTRLDSRVQTSFTVYQKYIYIKFIAKKKSKNSYIYIYIYIYDRVSIDEVMVDSIIIAI